VPYSLADKLVVAVASSALFDLSESDRVYREQGETEYRKFQRAHDKVVLEPGIAFPLIRRLLGLNGPTAEDRVVEVILLSKNDPDTGLRVWNSIQHHGLDITRAAFVSGRDPCRYLAAFNAALFLSANPKDVKDAIMQGAPAGRVFPTKFTDDPSNPELRIAFDFDGVIGDDAAEAIFRDQGLAEFLRTEKDRAAVAHPKGPLHKFFSEVSRLQKRELSRKAQDATYAPRIRIAIVTARSAPAHERVVTSLREWGIQVDEVIFLGGIEKSAVLEVFQPHIFFDDQLSHIEGAAPIAPCAHVPFGIANQAVDLMTSALDAKEAAAKASSSSSPGLAPPTDRKS
jgi:5'-nucleotidase